MREHATTNTSKKRLAHTRVGFSRLFLPEATSATSLFLASLAHSAAVRRIIMIACIDDIRPRLDFFSFQHLIAAAGSAFRKCPAMKERERQYLRAPARSALFRGKHNV